MKNLGKWFLLFCVVFNFGAFADEKYDTAWKNGLVFLAKNQHGDGSFGGVAGTFTGYTALVVQAWNVAPDEIKKTHADFFPRVEKAVHWLSQHQSNDGSITDAGSNATTRNPAEMQAVLANYSTSAAIEALAGFAPTQYAEIITRGADFLRAKQVNQTHQITPDNLTFGGFGYGSTLRPDLSNTWFALSALKSAGEKNDSAVFRDALIYVKRCQNSSEVNGQNYASDDGGAMYQPGRSDAGQITTRDGKTVEKSFASMTCAMLDCYLMCGEKNNSVPVRHAVKWLVDNWNLNENVGQRSDGKMGLFYFYRVLAKTLSRYQQEKIGDIKIDWRVALREKILSMQTAEGFWVNTEKRFGEDNPILCTAYALSVLGLTK